MKTMTRTPLVVISQLISPIWLLFVAGCPSSVPSGSCDDNWFAENEPALFGVYLTVRNPQSNELEEWLSGTAFAFQDPAQPTDKRSLATNAHVVIGILDAFAGFRIERVYVRQSFSDYVFSVPVAYIHNDVVSSIDDMLTGQNQAYFPDVAILKVTADLPHRLPLASEETLRGLLQQSSLLTAGFPGDVWGLAPNALNARATYKPGEISNLAHFDLSGAADGLDADLIQHNIPVTPGTSGSPIVHCSKVVAVNAFGTAEPGGINNYGVQVRALKELAADVTAGSAVQFVMLDTIVELGPSAADDCCTTGSAGCGDQNIRNCVCEYEPSCCFGYWSEDCAALVECMKCGQCDAKDCCATLGWYGDGEYCDNCDYPDPDCGN